MPCVGELGPPVTTPLPPVPPDDESGIRTAPRETPADGLTSYADTMPPNSTDTRLCACDLDGLNKATMSKAEATTQLFMGPS
jgi:hypothetical protein